MNTDNQITDQVPENSPSPTTPIKQNSPDEEFRKKLALQSAEELFEVLYANAATHKPLTLDQLTTRFLVAIVRYHNRVKAGQVEEERKGSLGEKEAHQQR